MRTKFAIISVILSVILALCGILSVVTLHNNAFFSPDYDIVDLKPILMKDTFSEEDYQTLFYQTGLGKYAIDSIKDTDDFIETVLKYQQQFFKKNEVKCFQEAITTYMEYNVSPNGFHTRGFEIFNPKPGYVVIMEGSHSFGWRHGHAGLVINQSTVLEAPIIFQPASCYSITTWRYYPNFIMLRLKDTSDSRLQDIARNAKMKLDGVIYSPLAGVFNKKQKSTPKSVQCAYLVWYAFYNMGIDIDKNGDSIVTVNDIKNSDMFEVVQIYGYDPALFM